MRLGDERTLAPSPGALQSPHSVTGTGSVGSSVGLGRGVGTFVAFRGRWELGKQRGTQIEGQSLSRSAQERPHFSFPWVHLCVLSQGIGAWKALTPDILFLSPHPFAPALGRDGCLPGPPPQGRRKSLGCPLPLNSRLSPPLAAVPAGFCPQFQPLAVCPS